MGFGFVVFVLFDICFLVLGLLFLFGTLVVFLVRF